MTDVKWHEDHDNLVGLAEWLDCECCSFIDAADCIRFFEKPWKWEREYRLWRLWADSDSSEVRERCIDGVDDDEVTAESIRNSYDWVN